MPAASRRVRFLPLPPVLQRSLSAMKKGREHEDLHARRSARRSRHRGVHGKKSRTHQNIRSMNRCHLALAGAAILATVLTACSSAAPTVTVTVGPASPAISPSVSPISPTIGPSIPADGPFGAWWNKTGPNGTEGGGLLAQDNRANDLRYIAQDEASGDDAALSSDGAGLATDMTQAEADPPPYNASDYQQAMSDYIKAGNDYANGDTTAGDTELQIANTVMTRWGRTVQPVCPDGGDCVDQRSFASATPNS